MVQQIILHIMATKEYPSFATIYDYLVYFGYPELDWLTIIKVLRSYHLTFVDFYYKEKAPFLPL